MSTMVQSGRSGGCFVVGATSPREVTPAQVGVKAFNLMMMSEAGLSIPPAFVLGTRSCQEVLAAGGCLGDLLVADVAAGIGEIERRTGRQFGAGRRPLLVSVRSGAAVSMPGMLETVLNVGLSETTLPGLLRSTGNPTFVWDSYRRLIQAYAEVVEGCPAAPFARVLADAMVRSAAPTPDELDVAALNEVVQDELAVFESIVGRPFPQEPNEQLLGTVAAVFRSWSSPRAVNYRELHGVTDLVGTGVTVQAMVFGNTGVASGAGVAFSRDPSTGENRLFVDFILNAQGEDVVAGRHRADQSDQSIAAVPGLAHALQGARRRLEGLFRDAQDFEFTVQEGRLWILQTRTAKRTPWAELRISCDLVDEGIIDVPTALERLHPYALDAISHLRLADEHEAKVLGRGTGASDGVVGGRIALTIDAVRRYSEAGDPVVLVRDEASTSDIGSLAICRGFVTATGARTAHAVVVARQLGLACVVGCGGLSVDISGGSIQLGDTVLREGDRVTVDGAHGLVYGGDLEVVEERPEDLIRRVGEWRAGPSG
ncbi:MAG: PEP/pyruvate-binding domain-containing protein [Acidimicrobiales bacterium]